MGDKVQPVTSASQPNAVAGTSDDPKVKVTRDNKGRVKYEITTGLVIEGKIQKPSAMYILQRSPLTWNLDDLKLQLVPKLLGSVKRSPF